MDHDRTSQHPEPRTSPWRWRRVGIAAILLLSVGIAIAYLTGCTFTITPPRDLEQPVPVYLMNHGRHVGLLLPIGEPTHGVVEYAYGDWRWFALDKTGILEVFPTLFVPTRGTLGRYEWDMFNPDDIARFISHESMIVFYVERSKAHALRTELDSRFQANTQTLERRPDSPLQFVQYEEPYHLFSNCNHMTARWIQQLGCEVSGWTFFANFRLHPDSRETPANISE